jgi:GNAT superfamily N-acetyltransferase
MLYRPFRNGDPPAIRNLWSTVGTSRGFGRATRQDHFENFVYSKLYFDPAGLILAFDGPVLVGMGHAGFGAAETEAQVHPDATIDPAIGVISMLLVRPEYRNQGIGRELLARCRQYLADRGAKAQYFGGMFPLNPFYLGLYGGSEMPGILESEPEALQFIESEGYEPHAVCAVYQRKLDRLDELNDPETVQLRRQVDIQVESWPMPTSRWQALTLGSMPTLRYDMFRKSDHASIGRAWVWDMECFSHAWKTSVVGVTEFLIHEPFRRQGFARLLLHTILRHLRDQSIAIVEVQTMDSNEAARRLYVGMEFEKVDRGIIYRLPTAKHPPKLEDLAGPQFPGRRMRRGVPAGVARLFHRRPASAAS